jgi:quinone-modifying oxidoreductase subunit QmoC
MAEQIVSPDLSFVKEIIASGGDDLKKCYQCSTCTVVCNVTPDQKPFPRKEMLYAQWGLKDKLISNPDVWLCHQCSDCTAHCPRGAKPGEVLGAVRKMMIKEHATPGFLGAMTADPKYLLILFAIPAALFFVIIAALGHLNFAGVPRTAEGGISFSHFLPVPIVDAVFIPTAAFAAFMLFLGVKKYWAALKSANPGDMPKVDLVTSIYQTILDIATHKRFSDCNVARGRKSCHFAVFYAFVGLAITTTWGVAYLYLLKWESPYPLTDPMKIVGNISAIALIAGIIAVASNRLDTQKQAGKGSYFDWLFISVILGLGVTGFGAQLLRLANMAALAYLTYYAHLVFVFFLFAYAPYSKMAHMVYRTTAMVYARHVGRE